MPGLDPDHYDLPNPGTLPEVPRSYNRRVVRERDLKEIALTWGTAAAKEFMEKVQLAWPNGSFNPRPIGTAEEALKTRYYNNRREAADQLKNSIAFHPGFREVPDA